MTAQSGNQITLTGLVYNEHQTLVRLWAESVYDSNDL